MKSELYILLGIHLHTIRMHHAILGVSGRPCAPFYDCLIATVCVRAPNTSHAHLHKAPCNRAGGISSGLVALARKVFVCVSVTW